MKFTFQSGHLQRSLQESKLRSPCVLSSEGTYRYFTAALMLLINANYWPLTKQKCREKSNDKDFLRTSGSWLFLQ